MAGQVDDRRIKNPRVGKPQFLQTKFNGDSRFGIEALQQHGQSLVSRLPDTIVDDLGHGNGVGIGCELVLEL